MSKTYDTTLLLSICAGSCCYAPYLHAHSSVATRQKPHLPEEEPELRGAQVVVRKHRRTTTAAVGTEFRADMYVTQNTTGSPRKSSDKARFLRTNVGATAAADTNKGGIYIYIYNIMFQCSGSSRTQFSIATLVFFRALLPPPCCGDNTAAQQSTFEYNNNRTEEEALQRLSNL